MASTSASPLAQLARAAFWAALCLATFMALNPHPPHLYIDRFGDKVQHMLAFGTITVFAQLGFPAMPRWRIAERLSFVGALIEVIQSTPILHRDCDIRDWVADTLVIVLVTAWFVRRDGRERA